MDNQKTPYYYLSKYRAELMGLAIVWVAWYHSSFKIDFIPINTINNIFSFIKDTGYGGVDIFLLVSGIGIYHSLSKNSIPIFLKNRLNRIVPVWWIYFFSCLLLGKLFFHIPFTDITLKESIGFLTFTGFWLDMPNQGIWYIYAVMMLYLISPTLFLLLRDSKNKKYIFAFLFSVTLMISLLYINKYKLIFFSRIPVYIIGMYFSASLNEKPMQKKHWILCLAAFIAGVSALAFIYCCFNDTSWKENTWGYPFILIAPSFSIMFGRFLDTFQKGLKYINYILRKLGQSSLEILLITEGVFAVTKDLRIGPLSQNLTAFIVIVFGIIVGLFFHFIIEYFKSIFKKL